MSLSAAPGHLLCILRDIFNDLAHCSAQEVPHEPHDDPLTGKDRWKAELTLLKMYYIPQALENTCALSIPIRLMQVGPQVVC